jgi:RNA polymerase sigma-70 factor (ECF subfamily)
MASCAVVNLKMDPVFGLCSDTRADLPGERPGIECGSSPDLTNHCARAEHERSAVPDEALVERTLRGEEEAFRHLYERYRQPVFSTAYRIIQDHGEAQDAMQEVFAKVYRAASSWNPRKAKFSTWLYRLAVNHAIDCWRVRRRRAEYRSAGTLGSKERRPFVETSPDWAAHCPERALEKRERAAEVRRCVDALPHLQRRVFVLRHFKGLKLKEIAEKEGRPLATVKTSLYRATSLLRRQLQNLNGAGRQGIGTACRVTAALP